MLLSQVKVRFDIHFEGLVGHEDQKGRQEEMLQLQMAGLTTQIYSRCGFNPYSSR